jgi:protein-disulfide isomerase/uncharacterized membrane protein
MTDQPAEATRKSVTNPAGETLRILLDSVVVLILIGLVALGALLRTPLVVFAGVLLIGLKAACWGLSRSISEQWPVLLLMVGLFVGVFLSRELTNRSLNANRASWLSSGCATDSGADACNQVLQSRWGRTWGAPTALWGLAYFEFLLAYFAVSGRPDRRHGIWRFVPAAAAALGGLMSIHQTWVMYAVLSVRCPQCMTVHAINAFSVALILWLCLRPRNSNEGKDGPGRSVAPPFPIAVGGFALCLAVLQFFACVYMISQIQSKTMQKAYADIAQDSAYVRWRLSQSKTVDLPIREDDPTKGPADAPHSLVVFSDFQCTHCRNLKEALELKVLPEVGERVKLAFKHFPGNAACNPEASADLRAFACEAALAVEAARLQGGQEAFWQMHDLLFENQDRLDVAPYAAFARLIGLDGGKLETDMRNPILKARIVEDAELGGRIGVKRTPTAFLNGKPLGRALTAETLLTVLQEEPPDSKE